ncbi:hypothetical protein Barba22A_gp076 [Rheinheimera phage vB_RspM_Barba22A]|jgi:predicted transcriptional regulator|uniref:Uncharacterized protein n=82 Tax=Barbavirus TaxID=2733095 RepID=A0A4P8N2N5_9CAUD|nr:hypothetical protein HOV44_gp084 [Rheinheimera phage Barba5S]YP_009822816.1 hypothetical protein HOV45_gp080 [Rheinheimera phage Barba8S]YP_009822953.1 hypothetical protein HOV46_gp076 [Rheinheimera phage vB_RspM_Barba18A]QCQ57927.1 hypothetical protein Barba1A_gp076 [Rheinheimera phage vB_RspM_Barba1A]QCQ58063.1 hypothetical protein Barba1S_gp076 [Rheinheimera phage vB_RspM_Barba1S]QCQ58199.1 hypothetical protein Barba2A_gp076 [Rheinheimera phage vB_RspM_Barba2A]QCQ58335.1 hypothetical pr
MFKWIWEKMFPPTTEEQQKIAKHLKFLEENGVYKVVSERGGVRTEFKNEEAKKWYFALARERFKQQLYNIDNKEK